MYNNLLIIGSSFLWNQFILKISFQMTYWHFAAFLYLYCPMLHFLLQAAYFILLEQWLENTGKSNLIFSNWKISSLQIYSYHTFKQHFPKQVQLGWFTIWFANLGSIYWKRDEWLKILLMLFNSKWSACHGPAKFLKK